MKGNLYLIPNLLGGDDTSIVSNTVLESIQKIKHYIVENERDARRYLIKLKIKTAIDDLTFFVLDKHDKRQNLAEFIEPLTRGIDVGLISDAGCPAVADPGALVVAEAHKRNIPIFPLVGPSSILLALMASGLNGQQFSFLGYLPIQQNEKSKKIKELDRQIAKDRFTQIFIETPYRNEYLFQDILSQCQKNTKICLAVNLTLPDEFIHVNTVGDWDKAKVEIQKKQCIFLMYK